MAPPNTASANSSLAPPSSTKDVTAMSLVDVRKRISVSKPYIYKLMAQGHFPRPVKIGAKSLWLSDEIDAWLVSQRAARDNSAA